MNDLENILFSQGRVMSNSKSEHGILYVKITTEHQTLIMFDFAVKNVRCLCSKNTKELCFPKDMLSDLTKTILQFVAAHPRNIANRGKRCCKETV